MVVLELDDSLSVTVVRGEGDRCVYTVVRDGEQYAQYDTSADPRTTAGQVGLRNVIRRNVAGYEKSDVSERLQSALDERAAALTDELGER